MKVKKLLSLLSAAAMAVTSLTGAMTFTASADDADLFTFKWDNSRGGYQAVLASKYTELLAGRTDIVIPETYNDNGSHGEAKVVYATDLDVWQNDDTTITSITYPTGVEDTLSGQFNCFTKLSTVTWKTSGTLKFNGNVLGKLFGGTTTIKDVYIYATSISGFSSTSFSNSNESMKIHVVNEEVKNQLIAGSFPEERIEVMQATLPVPEVTLTCEDIYYGTEGGFKPSATVKVNNEPVEDAQVTFKIYGDEECTNEKNFPNGGYKSSSIPVGTYYFRATVAKTDAYMGALSNVVEVKVLPNVVSEEAKTALNEAIQAAKDFQSKNNIADYDADEWNKIFKDGLLSQAETIAKYVSDGRYSEEKVKAATEALNSAISGLVRKGPDFTALDEVIAQAEDIINNHADEYWSVYMLQYNLDIAKRDRENPEVSQAQIDKDVTNLKNEIAKLEKVDAQAEFEALQKAIENAEAYDAEDYTDESYAALAEAIEAGKAFTAESDAREMRAARTAITNAVNKLVLKPLEPFAYVYKNGKVATVLNGIAGEALTGAKKIKLTFDCASDVNFNSNATIEVKALVNGKESYQRINGNKGQASGETCEVTLELENAIEAGNEFDITVFTYAWNNAADYVYAITKVEFLDKDGNLLGIATARSIAKDNLEKAIADAEALDANKYTAASYAELTKALEDAKALEGATAAEMNAAIDAINAAVKALVEKLAVLNDAIAAAEAVDSSLYTADSYKALADALEAGKAVKENSAATEEEINAAAEAINAAIKALVKKSTSTTATTTATKTPVKTTRSPGQVAKDKKAAQKAMKQAKITKLTVKSKAKKKVAVSWKKVKKAKGYQVQVAAKKNFKKVIFKKFTTKNKLTIKNSKIKSKKTYFVRVRAYATYKDKNGKAVKVYSKWNKKLRKVKVK